ncbi:F-box/kelch-repeat protein At1g57790-like [Fagus crenata]
MAENIVRYSKEDEEKKEELDSRWSHLPTELLCLVSSHLLLGDFTIFRAVCKSWRSSTSLIRPFPSLIDSPHLLSPCLMSIDYHKCRFFHPTYYAAFEMDIPQLLGARIRFSKYGWLLLSRDIEDDYIYSVFFFNPLTKVKVELPTHTRSGSFIAMCFSSPPTSSDCFVLGICNSTQFGIIKRGEKHWTYQNIIHQRLEFMPSNCNPILYKGLCYCLDVEGYIGVFDPNSNNSKWIVYYVNTPFTELCLRNYLIESDGKLLAVFERYEEETPIQVFELLPKLQATKGMKPSKMVSRRLTSLGNRMLYISLGGSFLEPDVARGTGNKIYLPMIQHNKNIFYSLKSNMYQSFIGDYDTKDEQELRNCCWIQVMPTQTFNQDQDFEW